MPATPIILDGALPLPPSVAVTVNLTDANLLELVATAKRSLLALQLCLLIQYGVICILSTCLILYMRHNRQEAFRGDVHAARKIILPAFEPLLWILSGVTGLYALFFIIALHFELFKSAQLPKITSELAYAGRLFVFLLVLVYMFQPSVSLPALRRSVLATIALSCYTIPVSWLLFRSRWSDTATSFWILRFLRGASGIFYVYVFCKPPGRASRRTLKEYCVFAFVFQGLMFLSNVMFVRGKYDAGYVLTYANLLWASLVPIFIWRVLRADTEHWRGMSQRACMLQSEFLRQQNADNNNKQVMVHERISSQGLHVLIEMHRKYIIDFAYLELKQRIGVGSSAIVFNGILHSKVPVAVKVYTPADFTDETVAIFSNEAALCGALHHPNIVTFYGMCISPPTICLVSELCQGSLDDVTRAIARREYRPERQEFLIALSYMIDCARAVAHLHSFSPAFVHRDIKPSNFLLDAENNVKLTDFGESRSLPRSPETSKSMIATLSPKVSQKPVNQALEASEKPNGIALLPNEMTVRGTVDYMAPELITGKAGVATYGEAADVFALGMTMWDILHPGVEKYPMLRSNHLLVFDWVLDGGRPALDPRFHAGLRELIDMMWQADARKRPSAQQVVETLEGIQEEAMAGFALDLWEELGREVTLHRGLNGDPKCFSGAFAIQRMEELGYVRSASEGIRLGNAMMDAGVLHHVKHARSFENAVQTVFYFDEECIYLYQPMLQSTMNEDDLVLQGEFEDDQDDGASSSTTTTPAPRRKSFLQMLGGSQSESSATTTSERKNGLMARVRMAKRRRRKCACRKHGQRLGGGRSRHAMMHQSAATLRRQKNVPLHHRLRHGSSTIKTIPEENVLTTKLLLADDESDVMLRPPSDPKDFAQFESTANAMV